MILHAVIDTNILVSALVSSNPVSPTKGVIDHVRDGNIAPMINNEIIEEYGEVLSRRKFNFSQTDIEDTLNLFLVKGANYTPECLRKGFADPDDTIFYETYLMKDDAYLITGNLKHFPTEPRIVSPADIIRIINLSDSLNNHIFSEPQAEYISETTKIKLQRAWEAIERMRASAVANGIADMSIEEIDKEIKKTRRERRQYYIFAETSHIGIL